MKTPHQYLLQLVTLTSQRRRWTTQIFSHICYTCISVSCPLLAIDNIREFQPHVPRIERISTLNDLGWTYLIHSHDAVSATRLRQWICPLRAYVRGVWQEVGGWSYEYGAMWEVGLKHRWEVGLVGCELSKLVGVWPPKNRCDWGWDTCYTPLLVYFLVFKHATTQWFSTSEGVDSFLNI